MIYLLITTCLFNNDPLRKEKYIASISRVSELTKDMNNIKVIIVENNGKRNTFLDDLGFEVYYTNNNFIKTNNKGFKELADIFDCIKHYKIQDNDFIVKLTGRYLLHKDSVFIEELKKVNDNQNIHAIIKYGWWEQPVNYKKKDCITGVIGMRCKYVKQINSKYPCIEWDWAEASYLINDENIIMLDKVGIDIYPGGDIKYVL